MAAYFLKEGIRMHENAIITVRQTAQNWRGFNQLPPDRQDALVMHIVASQKGERLGSSRSIRIAFGLPGANSHLPRTEPVPGSRKAARQGILD